MENRKSLKLFICVSICIFILGISPSAFAYEVETHAYLTDEAINFYNQNYPNNPIKDEFKSYIIDGSRREDDAPRWTNHFYDPVNNLGLNDPRWGSGFSSKEWAQSDSKQTTFINKPIKFIASMLTVSEQENVKDMDVNFTWQQAVRYYRDGKIEKAMFALGHVLHLIEDASVPDHTRNDGHPEPLGDGSPYEIFSSKFSLKNPDTNSTTRLVNKKPFDNMPTLSNYFDEMAKYSNNNFYSEDTIEKVYSSPNPEFFRKDGKYNVAFRKDEYGNEYRLYMKRVSEVDEIKSELSTLLTEGIGGDKILIDYWSHLSTKSIQVAAGVINLFFNDIARVDYGDSKPINDDRNPISWAIDNTRAFAQITASFGRAITSSVANTVSNFFAQVVDIVKDNAQIQDQNLLTSVSLDKDDNTSQPDEQKIIGPSLAIPSVKSNDAVVTAIIPSYEPDKSYETKKSDTEGLVAEETGINLKQVTAQETISSSTQDKLSNKVPETSIVQKPIIQICSFQTSKLPTYQKLLINEIAWMGSQKSANDEWIELKNISGTELNISNWQVLDKEEQIKVIFPENTKILAGGFLLLERTDDNSVPSVKADIIYTGALSNSNEALRLFDDKCGLIDEVFANSEWPAGDAPTKRTMERQADLSWWTYNGAGEGGGDALILGTPKKENMVKIVYYGGSGGGSTVTAAVVETNNNSNVQPSKLLISEVQITGGTGKTDNDFVELYNPNDSRVNLKGYRLVKRTKTGTTDTSIKSWTDDAYIEAKSFYLWANSEYIDISVAPDITTSGSLASDNGVALRFGAEDTGTIIDSVAWGIAENSFIGAGVFSQNPGANKSIQRKIQNNLFIDTENNSSDFELTACPNPKAQSRFCAVSETNESNQAPSAFFDFSTTTPKTGEEIIFNAASSTDSDGNIVLYDWDFGDNQLASSTQATTTHSYSLAGSYKISLTIFDDASATSTAETNLTVASSTPDSNNGHILISEIMPGMGTGNSDAEFIELYNPTDNSIDLTNYELRRKSSVSATSTQILVKKENFTGKIIATKGFLLITSPEYPASTTADIIYSQYSSPRRLAYDDDAVILYNNSDKVIDEVDYENIDEGKSSERKALSGGACVSAQGDGEFLGNSCDTDSSNDWEIRNVPTPQSSKNFIELRSAPTAPQNFSAQYDKPNKKINLSWNESSDYSGATSTISYLVSDISVNPVLGSITTSSTTAQFNITEIGRDYDFKIKAIDKEGLSSDISTSTVSVSGVSIEDVNYFILNKTETSGTMGLSDRIFKPLATGVIDSIAFNVNVSYNQNIPGTSSDVNISLYEWLGGATTTLELGKGQLLVRSGATTVYSHTSGLTLYFSGENNVVLDSSKYYYFEINTTNSGLSIYWHPYVVVKAVSIGTIEISSPTNNYIYDGSSIDFSFKYLEPFTNKYNAVVVETRDFYTDAIVDNYRVDLGASQKTIGWHNLATTTRAFMPGFYKTKTTLVCSDSCESSAVENEAYFSVSGVEPSAGKLLNQTAFVNSISVNSVAQTFKPMVSGQLDSITLKLNTGGNGWNHTSLKIYEWIGGQSNSSSGTKGQLLTTSESREIWNNYLPGEGGDLTWQFNDENEINLDSDSYYYLESVTDSQSNGGAPGLYFRCSSNDSLIDGKLYSGIIGTDLYLIINTGPNL